MNYELLDTVMSFRRLLKNATETEINEVLQWVASIANNSKYCVELEPMQGVCVSMNAELKQRGRPPRAREERG